MRSISYLLGGKPRCFADCIDYMKNHNLKSVHVELKTSSETNEQIIIKRLLGFFTWDFNDLLVTYEEQFGGIIESESSKRQHISILNANRRLERRKKDFQKFSIDLLNNDICFKNNIS